MHKSLFVSVFLLLSISTGVLLNDSWGLAHKSSLSKRPASDICSLITVGEWRERGQSDDWILLMHNLSADTTPIEITHVPIGTGIQNRSIIIYARVTGGVGAIEVTLLYRRTGEQNYTGILMERWCPTCGGGYNATIPASAVSRPTIEYFISATDGTNYATDPAANAAANPHIISINLYPSPTILSNPSDITEKSMRLEWTKCSDDDFMYYIIYQSTRQGELGTAVQIVTERSITAFIVGDLRANMTYYFTVRVYDKSDLYTDSNEVYGTTPVQPSPSTAFFYQIVLVVVTLALALVIGTVVYFKKRKTSR